MSRKAAALNSAIGTGLGLLSQGMHADQQRAKDFAAQSALDSAQARREASLKQLEREWKLQDDAMAHQRGLEDIRATSEAALERSKAEREFEINNPTPADQALIGQRQASAEASRARADLYGAQAENVGKGGKNDLFGVVRPDSVTPQSAQKFQEHYDKTGETRWDLLTPRQGSAQADKFRIRALNDASNRADEQFRFHKDDPARVENFLELNPQLAQELQIDENTPVHEAMNKVQMHMYRNQIQRFGPEFGVGGQQSAQPAPQGGGGLLGDVVTGAQQQMRGRQAQGRGGRQGQPAQGGPVIEPMGSMPGAGQPPGQQNPGQKQPGTSPANPIPAAQLQGPPPEGTYVRDRRGTIWLIQNGQKVRVSG